MINVKYSVLCHYPSIVSKDCLTLGILFHNVTSNQFEFKTINKWDRVRAFNEDLDIEVVKLQLEAIKEEVQEFVEEKNFKINKYVKFYVNELKFTEVVSVNIKEDFHDFVNQCVRQYMPLEVNKKDRPSQNEQLNFIKEIMNNSSISYDKGNVEGVFSESVKFDFILNDYAFKIFKFNGKEENRLIKSVKEWAYDAYKLRHRYKVIFVTDVDFSCNKYEKLYKILNEESEKLITFSEIVSFIQNIA